MKKTGYITFGAVLAALSVVVMLMSYFPYLTYTVPALAGMFVMVAVIELDSKWASLTYAVSAVLSLLFAEPEAAWMYVFLFGSYPIVKALLEKIHSAVLKTALKLLFFNLAIAVVYIVLMRVMGLSTGYEGFGAYFVALLWIFSNFVFFVYDFAILRVSQWYIMRIHPRIGKQIKK